MTLATMTLATRIPAILALTLGAASVSASSLSFTSFDAADWTSATAGGAVETFEVVDPRTRFAAGSSATSGELDDDGYLSGLGVFTTLGGTGTGGQCATYLAHGGACEQIALQDDTRIVDGVSSAKAHGQGNILPASPGDPGRHALSSADTEGIAWTAAREDGGLFDRIVFALRDPADSGAGKLDIILDGTSLFGGDLPGRLANGATWLAVIDLDRAVASAEAGIATSRNDGFTFDGAALVETSPVPLPASVAFLLAGLGGLLALRRPRR